MKKIVTLCLIFFSLNLFAYEFSHSLLSEKEQSKEKNEFTIIPETIEYSPYKGGEFLLESLAITVITIFSIFGAKEDGIYISAMVSPLAASFVGNKIFDREGSTVGGYLGFFTLYGAYALGSLINNGDDTKSDNFMFLSIFSIPVGVVMGNAISQKKSQFDRCSLVFNTLGTIAGTIFGLNITSEIKEAPFYKDDSYKYYLPVLLSTTLSSMAFLSISRNLIADEPDNAGTYLGIGLGTLFGGLLGTGLARVLVKNNTEDSYQELVYPVGAGIGALLGSIAGFAISHTTVPGREMKKEKESISVTLLPPSMTPEKVPFIEKRFNSWSILNLKISF